MSTPETPVKMQVVQVRVVAMKAVDTFKDESKGEKLVLYLWKQPYE